MRNHAQAIVACDFFIAATATFQVLYLLVVLEVGSRKIDHCNVTTHQTADGTLQQFRLDDFVAACELSKRQSSCFRGASRLRTRARPDAYLSASR